MSDNLEREIREIVAEILEVKPEEVTSESTINQLMEIDSVVLLEILVSLERRYQIDISEDEVKDITQLQHLVELIRRKTTGN